MLHNLICGIIYKMASSTIFVRSLRSVTKREYIRRLRSPVWTQDHKNYSKKATPEEEPDNGPLRFTNTIAQTWQAKQTRSGGSDGSSPWFQPYVISLSLSVFLIYFCILREENDIDLELGKTLYERIEGLEQKQLELSLAYNREHGLDTKDIEARLAEIDQEKIDGY